MEYLNFLGQQIDASAIFVLSLFSDKGNVLISRYLFYLHCNFYNSCDPCKFHNALNRASCVANSTTLCLTAVHHNSSPAIIIFHVSCHADNFFRTEQPLDHQESQGPSLDWNLQERTSIRTDQLARCKFRLHYKPPMK